MTNEHFDDAEHAAVMGMLWGALQVGTSATEPDFLAVEVEEVDGVRTNNFIVTSRFAEHRYRLILLPLVERD